MQCSARRGPHRRPFVRRNRHRRLGAFGALRLPAAVPTPPHSVVRRFPVVAPWGHGEHRRAPARAGDRAAARFGRGAARRRRDVEWRRLPVQDSARVDGHHHALQLCRWRLRGEAPARPPGGPWCSRWRERPTGMGARWNWGIWRRADWIAYRIRTLTTTPQPKSSMSSSPSPQPPTPTPTPSPSPPTPTPSLILFRR